MTPQSSLWAALSSVSLWRERWSRLSPAPKNRTSKCRVKSWVILYCVSPCWSNADGRVASADAKLTERSLARQGHVQPARLAEATRLPAVATWASSPPRSARRPRFQPTVAETLVIDHRQYMQLAIARAREVSAPPFAAAVIDWSSGKSLAICGNRAAENPLWHAEILAIRETCERRREAIDFRGRNAQ